MAESRIEKAARELCPESAQWHQAVGAGRACAMCRAIEFELSTLIREVARVAASVTVAVVSDREWGTRRMPGSDSGWVTLRETVGKAIEERFGLEPSDE